MEFSKRLKGCDPSISQPQDMKANWRAQLVLGCVDDSFNTRERGIESLLLGWGFLQREAGICYHHPPIPTTNPGIADYSRFGLVGTGDPSTQMRASPHKPFARESLSSSISYSNYTLPSTKIGRLVWTMFLYSGSMFHVGFISVNGRVR